MPKSKKTKLREIDPSSDEGRAIVDYVAMAIYRDEKNYISQIQQANEGGMKLKQLQRSGDNQTILPGAPERMAEKAEELTQKLAVVSEHRYASGIVMRLNQVTIGTLEPEQMIGKCAKFLQDKNRSDTPPTKSEVLEYMTKIRATLIKLEGGKYLHDEIAKNAVLNDKHPDKAKHKDIDHAKVYLEKRNEVANKLFKAIEKLQKEIEPEKRRSASLDIPDDVKALVESGQWKSVPLGNDQQTPTGAAPLLAVAKPAADRTDGFTPT
jgi:hypothetical protein